jgi:hypothetical protein
MIKKAKLVAASLIALWLLTACGGGDSGPKEYWYVDWSQKNCIGISGCQIRKFEPTFSTEAECKNSSTYKNTAGLPSNAYVSCVQVISH